MFFTVGTSVYKSTNTLRGFPFLHTSSAFVLCELLNDGNYDWSEVVLDCVFDLPFSNKYQCWASFNVPVGHLHVFFGGRFISVFSLFLHCFFLQFLLLLLLFNSMIKLILLLEKQSRFTHLGQVYLMGNWLKLLSIQNKIYLHISGERIFR